MRQNDDIKEYSLTPPGGTAVSSETMASASLSSDFFSVSRARSSFRFADTKEDGPKEAFMVTASESVWLWIFSG